MKKYFSLLLVHFLFISLVAQTEKDSPKKNEAKKDTTKKGPFKEWKEVLKDTREINGFIRMHLKRDNTLYFELDSTRLDKDFGMSLHYCHGPSEIAPTGIPAIWGTRLIRFRRYGDQIAFINYNEKYTAAEGSTMKSTLDGGIGHSILAMFKIESENKVNRHFLIDVTPFFTSDYVNNAQDLKYIFDNKPLAYEKEKSFVEKAMGFERNNEIDATISYRSNDPSIFPIDVVSDPRFISVGIRYSLFALPDHAMKPRLADDRVGHFMTALRDYSKDKSAFPYNQYIDRWRLEKKNPTEAVSEPVKPIVYYLDNSIPVEYRKYVKEGIEAWNKAFLKAGFKNAIIAKEQPSDSSWNAEDIRYSSIRWIPDPGGWAIGPHEVDPRTGEILNADILIASSITNWFHQQFQEFSGPQAILHEMENIQQTLKPWQEQYYCMAQVGLQHQLSFQGIVLETLGGVNPGELAPEKYIGDAIRDLVMHEVGHTLGLRHNFKASSGIPYDKLNDTSFTREHGLTLSVMDYAPVNVAPDPNKQGHYWNVEVGEYDVWAIEYAYTPFISHSPDENEQSMLRTIASQVNEPLHTYGTDEDNWLGVFAVDPLANAWELGSDPQKFSSDRNLVIQKILPQLEKRLIGEGDNYYRLRNAFTTLIFINYGSLVPMTKMIGGLYFTRNHKGDPDEQPTFVPVSAQKQREAVETISRKLFAEDAFKFSPELLNKLAPNRYSHWGTGWGNTPVDYPLLQNINFLQTNMLENILHPVRLERMLNNELRVNKGEGSYGVSELLQALTGSICNELKNSDVTISIIRKNLQMSYIDQLIRLYTETPAYMVYSNGRMIEDRVPSQVRSLVRLELVDLLPQIQKASKSAVKDRELRAHLEALSSRIEKVLAAGYILPLK
jgi:uncharacterized protein DUF4953/uncharacterized protein DUF5117